MRTVEVDVWTTNRPDHHHELCMAPHGLLPQAKWLPLQSVRTIDFFFFFLGGEGDEDRRFLPGTVVSVSDC